MQYVVWFDSGPQLVTPELADAVDAAKEAILPSFVSRFVIGIKEVPSRAVIYQRAPGKSGYVEQWSDEASRRSYEISQAKRAG